MGTRKKPGRADDKAHKRRRYGDTDFVTPQVRHFLDVTLQFSMLAEKANFLEGDMDRQKKEFEMRLLLLQSAQASACKQ